MRAAETRNAGEVRHAHTHTKLHTVMLFKLAYTSHTHNPMTDSPSITSQVMQPMVKNVRRGKGG